MTDAFDVLRRDLDDALKRIQALETREMARHDPTYVDLLNGTPQPVRHQVREPVAGAPVPDSHYRDYEW